MSHDMTQDELSMYEKLYALMGAKVKFKCDRIAYQGIVGTIIIGSCMFTLRHTSIIGGDYLGVTRFRFHEIESLTVVESKDVVNRYPKNDYVINILKNKTEQKYIPSEVLYNDDLSDSSDDEQSVCDENEEEEFVLDVPSHLKIRLPSESAIIDCINECFEQAIYNIFQESIIGVSFEGHQISRFGGISIICISTVSCTYIFDIEKLSNNAFDNGLRDIFEDTQLKKVIHDCRFPSDCLAHRYSTQLTNVFDTQVADFVISMQCYNDKYEYKYISSLDCCLRNHLQIPPEFLYKRVKGMLATEKSALYTNRPINNDLKYDVIKSALYLVLLQNTLAEKLLGPLHRNVSAYLNVIANASDAVVKSLGYELSSPNRIPASLLMNGIQTAKFHKSEKKDLISLLCKFKNPITGQIIKPDSDSLITRKGIYSKQPNKSTNEKCNKENTNVMEENSKYPKHNLNIPPKKVNSCDPEKNSAAFDSMVVMPCSRYTDEVYHKLVHNMTISDNSHNIIDAKPSDYYVSRFSVRKPFSDCRTESSKPGSDESVKSIWTKLREESVATSLHDKVKQKIRFVPAGMS